MEQYPQRLTPPLPPQAQQTQTPQEQRNDASGLNSIFAPLQQHHDPVTLSFPDAPTTELAPIQPQGERNTSSHRSLPSLSSLTRSLPITPEPQLQPAKYWPNPNPLSAFYEPSNAQPTETTARQDVEMSAASPEQRYYERRSASVSLDDPDVRMAAEALGDLRAGT